MLLLNILDRINASLARVKHITAFVSEDTLKLILVCLIVAFTAASGVVLFMILLRRTILINHTSRRKKLVEKYEIFLSESITYFYENDKIFEKKDFTVKLNNADQRNNFNRKVLLEQILLMKKHVGGEESHVLSDLYKKLGFDNIAFKNLNSWHWYTRLQALQELMTMEAKSAHVIYQKMTLDPNSYVRIAAIKGLILRGGYLPNGQAAWQPSLIRYSYDLSAWEQSQIFDALSRHQGIQLPDFTPLLYSLNPTVVVFGLRMIKYFHCMDAVEQVLPFLKSENPALVKATEEVLVQFGYEIGITDAKAPEEILISSEKAPIFDFNTPNRIENEDLLAPEDILNSENTIPMFEDPNSITLENEDLPVPEHILIVGEMDELLDHNMLETLENEPMQLIPFNELREFMMGKEDANALKNDNFKEDTSSKTGKTPTPAIRSIFSHNPFDKTISLRTELSLAPRNFKPQMGEFRC